MIESDLINLANFNEIVYSTNQKPYIGINNLTNGIVIYLTDGINSLITHTLNDYDKLFNKMLNKIKSSTPLVVIFYGHQTNTYLIKTFKKNLTKYPNYKFKVEEVNVTDYFNLKTQAIEFVINTHTQELHSINTEILESENKYGRN